MLIVFWQTGGPTPTVPSLTMTTATGAIVNKTQPPPAPVTSIATTTSAPTTPAVTKPLPPVTTAAQPEPGLYYTYHFILVSLSDRHITGL